MIALSFFFCHAKSVLNNWITLGRMQLSGERPWMSHQLSSVIKEFSRDDNKQSPWKHAVILIT